MTDDRLNELLNDAAESYRVPRDLDYDAMWSRIASDAFPGATRKAARRWASAPTWRVFVPALAAALVIGIGLGRLTPHARTTTPAVAVAPRADSAPQVVPADYDRAATELLGRTAILLTALPTEASHGKGRADAVFASQAIELLSTTRLLLDSPAASDRRFKELLEDLELVLAQIARLRTGRSTEDIQLITDALEERDVVPRIRSAVARLASGDN